ncbi:MAG: hypothetical protein LBR17_07945 [Bacteroidales bacterium]|jgi:hypothetical protein|nr:hypothetical protein [Bacteroidales bacterium]
MNKIISLLFILLIAIFAACGKKQEVKPAETTTINAPVLIKTETETNENEPEIEDVTNHQVVIDTANVNFHYKNLLEAEQLLIRLWANVGTEGGLGLDYDNPENSYEKFVKPFVKTILSDTSTMNYTFKRLTKKKNKYNDVISVTTSNNGNLRFYSWITPYGGTMPDVVTITQFRSDSGIFAECVSFDPERTGGHNIWEIETTNQTYYLLPNWIRGDSQRGVAYLNVVTIEGSKLNYNHKFFKNKDEFVNNLSVPYNCANWFFTAHAHNKEYNWDIAFDDKTSTLYIPIPSRDIDNLGVGNLSDQYSKYKFNGKYFEYIGQDGGFWLHPSIRKFDKLVNIFTTNKYTIRIDYMGNDKYRYVSWNKGKSMGDKPDLVIENGLKEYEIKDKYDNIETCRYSFINAGYKYICERDTLTICDKNGKVILLQKKIIH